MTTRRRFLSALGLAAAGSSLPMAPLRAAADASARGSVLVVGGGFAGASCARALRAQAPGIAVTLIEPKARYTACPLSNLVIAGQRPLAAQQFSYDALAAAGVRLVSQAATGIDPQKRQVRISDGSTLAYDRLVVAPGIELRWNAIEGYDQAAAQQFPHAWQAGEQTDLLRRQLAAMKDGGLVIITAPESPYRCPPGPYERASLVASYLKRHKPRSKLMLLDAKDNFSKKTLFTQAWRALYGDMIEWQGASDGATLAAVDPRARELRTDFDRFEADVANVIPPQRAGAVARNAGLTDASGWCPIDALTFESTLQENIHVIGDAAIASAMPKSAFAANAQAKLCAVQVSRLLRGEPPIASTLLNTCYSLVDSDYGISVAGVYRANGQRWQPVDEAGGTSPVDADLETRKREADYASDWFNTLTRQVFG